MILIGLMFRPHSDGECTGVLYARVIIAKLPDCIDSLVSLQFSHKIAGAGYTQETAIEKEKFNPTWNQIFQFVNVSLADLKKPNALQVTLVECTGKIDLVRGCLRLGMTTKSKGKCSQRIGSTNSHWQRMMENPGKEIKVWHSLEAASKEAAFSRSVCAHSNIQPKMKNVRCDEKKVSYIYNSFIPQLIHFKCM